MTSLPEPLIITGKHLAAAFLMPDRKAASLPTHSRAVQVQGGFSPPARGRLFRRPEGRVSPGNPTVSPC